jgi:hypothetical protein
MHHDVNDDVPQVYKEYVYVFQNQAEVEGYIQVSVENEACSTNL